MEARRSQAGKVGVDLSIASSNNPNVGAAMVTQFAAPSSASTTIANRNIGGTDGILSESVTRKIGQFDIGGLPDWIKNTSGCSSQYPAALATTGFIALTNYADSVTATAGSAASDPVANVSGGTLKYYTGQLTSASTPTTVDLTTAAGRSYSIPSSGAASVTCTASNRTVTVSLTPVAAVAMNSLPTTSSTPSGSGAIVRNDVTSTIGSPIYGQLLYKITTTVGGGSPSPLVEVLINVNLGTITATSGYGAAPTAG